MKLIYLYYNDQLKNIFTANESVNLYNTREITLLFIPQVNTTHYDTMVIMMQLLRCNSPVIWNDFFQNTKIARTSVIQLSLNLKLT